MCSARSSVILIGPYLVGKGTVAKYLSKELRWPLHSLDLEQERYLQERDDYEEIQEHRVKWELHSSEWQPYDAYVVERFLADYSTCGENRVFDFGAGHSVYDDEILLSHISSILASYFVVLLLPSQELKESLEMLLDRARERGSQSHRSDQQINDSNQRFIECSSNYALADLIVYTKGKSPEEIGNEILRRMGTRL